MIIKIKLIHEGIKYIFKRCINWNCRSDLFGRSCSDSSVLLQPMVGMTVIIPEGSKSFRFYIGYIVADLRTNDTVLVERREFRDEKEMNELAEQLRIWDWEREV